MNFIFFDEFSKFLFNYINNNSVNPPKGYNLIVFISSGIFISLLFILFIQLFQRKVDYKNYDPDEYDPRFKKIGGFLLLIIPLLFFDFVKNTFQLYNYSFLFENKAHFFLTEIKISFLRNWWTVIIYFIIFTCEFKVVFSIFNLLFLFCRKRLFKFLLLFYIPICILIDGLKYFFVTQVVEPNNVIIYTVFTQWSESIYLAVILFSYILFSRRINAAFFK